MILAKLIQDLPGLKVIQGSLEVDVQAITYDSRRVQAGDLFCAIRGLHFDGHEFVSQAAFDGASVLLCDHAVEVDLPGKTVILCEDSRELLPILSSRFYGHPSHSMRIVGITGTNGKTTTTYYLQHLLRQAGIPTGRMGTTGLAFAQIEESSLHTTPEAPEIQSNLARMRDAGMEAAVMEVSSHALQQHRTDAIDFNVALFTNLTQDHLDYHPDMDHYLQAKRRLFRMLDESDMACYNADDPQGMQMMDGCRARVVSIGWEQPAAYRILEADHDGELPRLQVQTPTGTQYLSVRTIGSFNYMNALAAFAIATELGADAEAVAGALQSLPSVPGRLEDCSRGFNFRVFVDYAHTPDALERTLRVLKQSFPDHSLTCVFGCGGDRDRQKRPRMGQLATSLADQTIITDDNPRSEPSRQIIEEILTGVEPNRVFKVIPDRTSAIEAALDGAGERNVIAILGKGHEDYQEIQGQRYAYSDLDVIRQYRRRHGR